ncbi:arylesterase [Roseicyclus persicicus]|uniref:Arylesterase n=1 Tax=Roseicyclus persicicus TaxID=2650661 RepID=A0A7X6GZZ2_9RHOB|nr:arylesterase [Roseibacterium persicicum]NKX45455.1 arylesterase [Roseibacterium persicicum]
MAERFGLLRSFAYGAWARAGKALAVALIAAAPASADVTIAALGDSLTQGYGLMPEDGLVPQLQAWLEARGHAVTVLNAGVSGDTTAGGLARVGWTLTPEVDAMIVALGGNDLLRAIPPEASRANLEGILQAAQAAGVAVLLVGMQAPGNYGPEFKEAFDAMYPELAAQYGAIHVESLLAPIAQAAAADPAAAFTAYMQPDGLHPNPAGVALIVEALGPAVESLIAAVPQS